MEGEFGLDFIILLGAEKLFILGRVLWGLCKQDCLRTTVLSPVGKGVTCPSDMFTFTAGISLSPWCSRMG